MSTPRVVAIIQARTGSTRFPGKVLADLCGRPLLEQLLRRVVRSRCLHEICVATTTHERDDAVADLTRNMGLPVVRGAEEDVLGRMVQAAIFTQAAIVVRLTADNPLVDSGTIDHVVAEFLRSQPPVHCAFTSPASYPHGLSVEVVDAAALMDADAEADTPSDREHVTTFIRSRPDRFPALAIELVPGAPHQRWSVDTPADLDRVRSVLRAVGGDPVDADPRSIIDAMDTWLLTQSDYRMA